MTDWKTNLPRQTSTNRYRNEDANSLGTSVPGIFDPANPVFHGTNTGTPWTGVFGNGGLNTTTVGPDAKTLTTPASAYGWKTKAEGTNSVAMGTSTATKIVHALGTNSVAIGTPGAGLGAFDLIATGTNDVVIGCNVGSLGVGGSNTVVGSQCGILGGTNSAYVGANGSLNGNNDWVFGQTILVGNDNVVSGNVTGGTGDRNVYISANILAAPTFTGNDQTHVGSGVGGSTANGTTSFGAGSTANAAGASAFGFNAAATGAQSTSIGRGITNAAANSTIIGNNATPSLRLLDPAVGSHLKHLVPAGLASATPTPTVAQLSGGLIACLDAGAVTFTQTNLTGAALDAYAPFLPLTVGMTLEVLVTCADPTTDITIGAAAAGVTTYGSLAAKGANINRRLVYVRTGAAAWSCAVY